ncbi:WecB/TagA/CpsF family glycosyltransferase [Neobacillus cucumis]|uniref:WecB/TagA/CpsF family glycosyltransferase n=1 Tax=Neobacillus cucumis TaxID=1740721 RepID=UPI002040364A|nr:WecB/TagA/CpsF family glycosyltransferase [Neobacillus cucumis]MCM3729101.1 WecB/TagA/CpsF family glycosyltransferase [Neobacillus cucumis]
MITEELGNVKVNLTDEKELLPILHDRLVNKEKTKVFFLNAHCYNIAQKDEKYRANLNKADFVLNDGIGVDIGAKIFNFKFKENLNGTDLTPKILEVCAELSLRVFLLGGKPGVAEKASENMRKKIPFLNIVGTLDGYFKESTDVVSIINKTNPDVIICALGVPYQENWISDNFNKINGTMFLAVGAFLDFASNNITRAPKVFRKLKSEWIYRLLLEPKRMWKRYLIGNFTFIYYILKNKVINNSR